MNLSTVNAERVPKKLKLGALGELNVEYNPRFWTPAIEKRISVELASAAENFKTQWLVPTIHGLIKKWDLIADNEEDAELFGVQVGDVVPLTQEAISNIPSPFLMAVFSAFGVEDDAKNAESFETSDNGCSMAEISEPSPTTTPSSKPRSGSVSPSGS